MAHREDTRTNAGADNRKATPADTVAAAANAREAWAVFQAKYARGVRRYFECDRQLRGAADEIRRLVQDVVNEAFALTWPYAQDADSVHGVLNRLERDAAREYKRFVRREVALKELNDLPDRHEVDPLATIDRRERLEWLYKQLSRLSVRDRLVIEGPLDGKSDEDIARDLDCAIPTVKRRRYRLLQDLRRDARTSPEASAR